MAGRHGMSLMWPGPIDQATHDLYVETWHAHRGDTHRVDGPNSVPRVGITMVLAISPNESHALEIARRGLTGLLRRAHNVHRHDHDVLPEDECDAALGPLRRITANIEAAINAGAGTASQITDRFGGLLAAGLTDYIVLQIPVGDMTLAEAKDTMDVFCSDVKPALEAAA